MINVSFEQAKDILDNKQGMILDVREEEEYLLGHATNAILFPLDTINKETSEEIIPSKDTPVMVYCKTGSRSGEAAQKLDDLGYKNVYNIGSLVGWPYGMDYEY